MVARLTLASFRLYLIAFSISPLVHVTLLHLPPACFALGPPQFVQPFLSVTISHYALHPHFALHPHLLRIPPFALHPPCVACVSGVHCSICAIFLVCDLLSSFHFCSFTVFPPFCSIAFVIYSAIICRLQKSFHCVL